MAESVSGRGKWIVALVVLAAVVAAVVFALGRDDLRSTPVEDAVAGRASTTGVTDPTDSDPGLTPEETRPQGREAPDSNEGVDGAGSPAVRRGALEGQGGAEAATGVDPTDPTGRNAAAAPGARVQDAPTGSLTEGPNRGDAAEAGEPGRQ